jgi:flagellar motor switch protein FliN/FliY
MISSETVARYADLPVELVAELGRTTLTVREILRLEPDHLITLARSAGESLDFSIGGACIGRGEIVVAGDSLALRIGALREEG